MGNPLFNSYGNQNPFSQLMEDAKQFKENFKGNPKDEVQRLLNSGEMSQAQFNEFSRIAQRLIQAMK